jgi:hypothetical protein
VTTHETGVPPDGEERQGEHEAQRLDEAGRWLVPWPLAAAALLAVLALILGVGLAANARQRPQSPIAPQQTPTPAPHVVVMATSKVTPLAATSPALTPQALTVTPPRAEAEKASNKAPATEVRVIVAPTVALTEQANELGSHQTSTSDANSDYESKMSKLTLVPTVDLGLESDIVSAYRHYWDVRADAFLNLDPTHLSDVSADPHLTVLQNTIDQLRAEGHAIKTKVHLNFRVVSATTDTAIVSEDFVDDSSYVDPDTKEVLPDDNNGGYATGVELKVAFKLREMDDVWKVVDSARAQ